MGKLTTFLWPFSIVFLWIPHIKENMRRHGHGPPGPPDWGPPHPQLGSMFGLHRIDLVLVGDSKITPMRFGSSGLHV